MEVASPQQTELKQTIVKAGPPIGHNSEVILHNHQLTQIGRASNQPLFLLTLLSNHNHSNNKILTILSITWVICTHLNSRPEGLSQIWVDHQSQTLMTPLMKLFNSSNLYLNSLIIISNSLIIHRYSLVALSTNRSLMLHNKCPSSSR